MSNYRIDRAAALASGHKQPVIVATGDQADGESVFTEFQAAKAAALREIDNEVARLRERRMVVRALNVKAAKLGV